MASQPASGWPWDSTLVTCTSPPPPTHGSRVSQTSIPATRTVNWPAFTIYLAVLYIYLLSAPNKPVYTEPLGVTVPVVIGTCTVLVGTVVYVNTGTATRPYK